MSSTPQAKQAEVHSDPETTAPVQTAKETEAQIGAGTLSGEQCIQGLRIIKDLMNTQRDALQAKVEALEDERKKLLAERDAGIAETLACGMERDALKGERDALENERNRLLAERDALGKGLAKLQLPWTRH